MSALLQVRDLNAYYGKSHVLRGVNLHVGEGEVVALLGRNGVGRSTTVKAIMGRCPRMAPSPSMARILPVFPAIALPIRASVMSRKTVMFSR